MTDARTAAEAEAALGGLHLPASKREVLAYARDQGTPGRVLDALAEIPDRQYRTLDEVAEAVSPVQPSSTPPGRSMPKPESGEVPGREAYTDADEEPGWIRGEPEILEYEQQLVRAPAEEPGKGVPKKGKRASRPKKS